MLTRGDPDGPPLLTLRHAYQYLNRVLAAHGFPKPYRRASGRCVPLLRVGGVSG